jgi:predicted RNA methylase
MAARREGEGERSGRDTNDNEEVAIADMLAVGGSFDTVVMNPPFGTRSTKGIDVLFLERALAAVRPGGSIYYLHKTSKRGYLGDKVRSEWGQWSKFEVVAELRHEIPAMYAHHKKKSVDVKLDLVRVTRRAEGGSVSGLHVGASGLQIGCNEREERGKE